jgi:hypothetical protein
MREKEISCFPFSLPPPCVLTLVARGSGGGFYFRCSQREMGSGFFSLAKSPHGEQREKEKMPSTS